MHCLATLYKYIAYIQVHCLSTSPALHHQFVCVSTGKSAVNLSSYTVGVHVRLLNWSR